MSVMFGSARIDEHGKAKGGAAGDQTGGEVSTQAYYTSAKGWVGLRAVNTTIANKLAEAMQQACDNPHIGYDQNQRTGVITQLAKYGSLKAIVVNTEADCSSLVRACIIQATGSDPGNFNTATEKATLLKTGLFREVKITKADDCRTGDILVTKVKGHTGIITSAPAPLLGRKAIVTASALHVRRGPAKTYAHVRYLHKGDLVTVYDEVSGWGRIGTNEWVSLKYLK